MSEGYVSVKEKKTEELEKIQLEHVVTGKEAIHQPKQDVLAEQHTGKTLSVTKLLDDMDDKRMNELPKETELLPPMEQGAMEYIRNLLKNEKSGFAKFTSRDRGLILKCILSELFFLTEKENPELLNRREIEALMRTVEQRLSAARTKDTTLIFDEDEEYRAYVFQHTITQTPYLNKKEFTTERKKRSSASRRAGEYLSKKHPNAVVRTRILAPVEDKEEKKSETEEKAQAKESLKTEEKAQKKESSKTEEKTEQENTKESAFAGMVERRLNKLFYPGDGSNFSAFLEVLRKDDRFLAHLGADTDQEYGAFLEKAIPACKAIVKEFEGHIYVDQYFLEREKELSRIIVEGRTKNIGAILGLDRLDRDIEERLIGEEKKLVLPTPKELDEMQPDELIRPALEEVIRLQADFKGDPRLERTYRAVLKKMLIDTKNKDRESIQRDLLVVLRLSQAVSDEKHRKEEAKRANELPETEKAFRDGLNEFIKKNVEKEDRKLLDERMKGLTAEELRLIAYFIQNSTEVASLEAALEHVTEYDPKLYVHLQDSAAALAFIRGDAISPEMLNLDYEYLREFQLIDAKRFKRALGNALILTDDCRKMRALKQRQALEKKEDISLDPEIVRTELKCARKTAYQCIEELAKDMNLCNEEKLWRFYTVIRTYSDVFDRYRECEKLGGIEILPGLTEIPDLYARLQEYFSLEERNPETLRKIYGTEFAKRIGIIDLTGVKGQEARRKKIDIEIQKEMTRQQIKAITRVHIMEKTGMVKKQEKVLTDPDEKAFTPETVAAVKKMDRWIVENIKRRVGDSDSNFVMELLGHPLRDRLLVYYLIENGKEQMPTELDAAVAVTGYVPDVAKFTGKLKKFFLLRAANIFRWFDVVDESGLLNTAGRYSTKKIEGVIRLLDDPSKGLDRYLEKAVESRKHMLDPDFPEEVRYRQLCYIALMEDVTKLRTLTRGMPPEKMEKSEAVAKWRTRIERSLSRLVKANEKVKKIWEDDEIAKKFASTSVALPWNFDGEKLKDSIRDTGLEDFLSNISNFAAMCFAAKAVFEPNLSFVGRVRRIAQTADKAGQTITRGKYIGMIVDFFTGSSFGSVFKVIGKSVSSLATMVKSLISTGQYAMVSQAAKGATEFAKDVQEEEKKRSEEQKTELPKNEEQKTEKPKEKTSNEEPLPQVPLPDFEFAVKSTIDIQKHILRDEVVTNLMRTAGSLSSIVATFIPDETISKAVGEISDVMMVTRVLFAFWSRSDLRKKTMDEFLNLDDLSKRVTPMVETLDQQTQVKYGYYRIQTKAANQDAVKDALRMEVLRQLHFSSMEEFFSEITQRYAAVIYRHIFFDEEGKVILADNEEAIEKRRPLCKLFPNLKFTYPKNPGESPAPGIIQIGWQLSRGVT